jgi:predicted porin
MKQTAFVLALALSAALGPVPARAQVVPYGTIDNALEYQDGGAGSVTRAVSSGLYASVYGFKGSEDLGDGTRVDFQLEQGFSGVTGTASDPAAAFNRLAWIGISGKFGEVRIGRQKKPEYLFLNNEMDPSGVRSIASPLNNFGDDAVRSSNAVAWFTPTIHGFTEQFMVALREETGKSTLVSWNAAVRYVNGLFRAAAGYERTGKAGSPLEQRVFRAVVSRGAGKFRYYLAYQTERRNDGSEKRDIHALSVSWRVTPDDGLSLMLGQVDDRTGEGSHARQVGLLYEHLLSKRTTLYSAAGLIDNRNAAQFTLDGTQYSGIPGAPGAPARGINLGIAHKF